ncbi:hypothetical protein [Paracidobacterium acidisoli]|uniref:CopG family transcriptional regulator n=1 Tax=Paracidobacterium acidisoli TaxID=2303751 RepID=A0A372ILR8_9BACT|nr:hypothetical protein [Paracidobacterium acidisoli]MBT9332510.1 ribbon-helix-helix domain-containing protein [Paracidobacterium acidisoli]
MDVHLNPELQTKIEQRAAETSRTPEEIIEEAISGYFEKLAHVREKLGRRYNEIKSGKVKLLDGEACFEALRRRERELLK